jgi:hypothetical protein
MSEQLPNCSCDACIGSPPCSCDWCDREHQRALEVRLAALLDEGEASGTYEGDPFAEARALLQREKEATMTRVGVSGIVGNVRAIQPFKFVCAACGKKSATKYGLDGERDSGWDESCMLNSVLCERILGATPEWHAVDDPRPGVHYEVMQDSDD